VAVCVNGRDAPMAGPSTAERPVPLRTACRRIECPITLAPVLLCPRLITPHLFLKRGICLITISLIIDAGLSHSLRLPARPVRPRLSTSFPKTWRTVARRGHFRLKDR